MRRVRGRAQAALALLLCLAAGAGCQRQKGSDTGKTYAPDSKPAQGGTGGQGSGGGQSDAGPLNAPADTTNGKVSPASDAGSSSATRGQVVSEPGAPVEPSKKDPGPRKPETPPGH